MKAKAHDAYAYHVVRSVRGIGRILTLVILYEIEDIHRFPTVQQFVSYAWLIKCGKESAGKTYGYSGKNIGNAYLKWAGSRGCGPLSSGQPQSPTLSSDKPASTARAKRSRFSPTALGARSTPCSPRAGPSTRHNL
ncbi:MAG: transposase [Gammaproteobacteria bacterium]